ncbi:MAG: hypothetical protein PHQ43_09055 [Dehalococcoidales bacterium]|nr:hypothetical protein [Dehalococcoidales bacterium]
MAWSISWSEPHKKKRQVTVVWNEQDIKRVKHNLKGVFNATDIRVTKLKGSYVNPREMGIRQ